MVDPVTHALASLNVGAFTWIGGFLDAYTWWAFLFLAAVSYAIYPKVRNNKLRVLGFTVALLLASIVGLDAKQAYAESRPCWGSASQLKLPYCPEDYAFPSGHTLFSFVFAGASLGTSFFPLFFILAIIVAFSRVYMGVHTITDVTGGVVVGLAAYFAADALLRALYPRMVPESERRKLEKEKRRVPHFEVRRDVAHIVLGIGIIGAVLLLGVAWSELLLLLCLFTGMALMHLRMRQARVPVIDELFDLLERPGEIPAKGAFMYLLGALLALSFLGSAGAALAVIAVLAFGDGMATIVGELWGKKMPLFYNRKKSWPGTAAFVLFGSLAAFPFIGFPAVGLALVCAIVETADLKIDDNFLVPLAGVLFLLFLG